MTKRKKDLDHEGRAKYEVDIDRMVNEGLGRGEMSRAAGYVGRTTTDWTLAEQEQKANDAKNKADKK